MTDHPAKVSSSPQVARRLVDAAMLVLERMGLKRLRPRQRGDCRAQLPRRGAGPPQPQTAALVATRSIMTPT